MIDNYGAHKTAMTHVWLGRSPHAQPQTQTQRNAHAACRKSQPIRPEHVVCQCILLILRSVLDQLRPSSYPSVAWAEKSPRPPVPNRHTIGKHVIGITHAKT